MVDCVFFDGVSEVDLVRIYWLCVEFLFMCVVFKNGESCMFWIMFIL